jgi:transcription initiation factor IIF auxiliary subunit
MAHKLALTALLLFIPGLSVAQSGIAVDNIAKPMGNNRWEWTVFVKGDAETISKISCVEYELHETFPDRLRRVCERGSGPDHAFPLTASGWGTFDIPVTIYYADGRTEKLTYHLRF